MDKDIRKIVKALEAQGFTVEATKGSHFTVRLDGRRVGTLASTPSDHRGLRNAIAALRRAGFNWPPKR